MTRSCKTGLIQIYTGDGKGKTTAAFGLALRAAGAGMNVYILQFIKNGVHGELRSIGKIKKVKVEQCGRGCFIKGMPRPADIVRAARGLDKAARRLASGRYGLVILDEVNCALDAGLLKRTDLMKLIRSKPKSVELVLTGRRCPAEVMRHADLVTEMKCIRHPYDRGIPARYGIEY